MCIIVRIGGWHVRHHATIVIRVPTRMEDVLLDILEFLELVLALLGHDWQGHRVQHNKDEPCILDILMQLIGDVVQDTFHVLLVNTEEVVEHDGWSHTPQSFCKLVDITHHIDIEGIA